MLTAALSLPSSPKTGALTLATPASLSATLSAQPLTLIPLSSAASGLSSTPPGAKASSTFPADPRESGMIGPHRHGVPQPRHPLHGRHAHPVPALPHVELRALPTLAPQRFEHGPRPPHEANPGSPVPPPEQAQTKDVPPCLPRYEVVRLQRRKKPVRRGTRQAPSPPPRSASDAGPPSER